MPSTFPRLTPLTDSALLLELGDAIDPDLNARAHALAAALRSSGLPGLGQAVPGYASLLVPYDPAQLAFSALSDWLRANIETIQPLPAAQSRTVEIPVRYGGADGPDLDFVAAHNHLTPAEVIARHTAPLYPVYFMGFAPGFPYLGGLDPRIAAPRLTSPRTRIPAGSVGIAGSQTGVYPLETPGGWRLIGRTERLLFDPSREPPFLLEPGDRVKFVAV
ncbi:sensor histidine kinase inhibitor, KipI family [Longilinea arvoryzae]|uniref:Sensor histidine kinase inhibitor, KipI family n=1 Tax=Longilinea arvoryzae TaxID=360412 RepID=A0A0K8MXF1_9CHLR|nr:5-oxoprolinase subunit PxpB [Longilinea arvoryzae]GAP15924.1 sensor histidine kinase inhibitor, KipI family [Longilinea arvoryzae]